MSPRDRILALKGNLPCILPSILGCDFRCLRDEVRRLEEAGVAALHVDVMDGVLVPNISFGLPIVRALRQLTDLPLDVHLMIQHPERYLQAFAEAGADALTFHIEATATPATLLQQVRDLGLANGIVVDHGTPVEAIADCVGQCDIALVMSVRAGFGGQSFEHEALDKAAAVRKWGGPDLLIEMDGGIHLEVLGDCVRQGVDLLVTGSAITAQSDYGVAFRALANEVHRVTSAH